MAFPLEALPQDHFQGLGNLATDEPDSLRGLLNRARSVSTARGYYVNPDRPDIAFATINAAYAAADAELPAEEIVVVRVSPGVDHALDGGAMVLQANRGLIIVSDALGCSTKITVILGDFTLTDADAESKRRQLLFRNVDFYGDIAGAPNWEIRFEGGKVNGTITRTHGTEKCPLYFFRCAGDPYVIDSSAPGVAGFITVRECEFDYLLSNAVVFSLLGEGVLFFFNSTINVTTFGGAVNALVDCNSEASAQIYWYNSTFNLTKLMTTDSLNAYVNVVGTTRVFYYGLAISVGTGSDIDLNSGVLQESGSPAVRSETDSLREPVSNPPVGTTWTDLLYGETLTWDGVYWDCGGGGVKRQELLVNIGTAALDHDVGFDIPASGAVVSTSFKLLKALTGGGGADRVGLGTGSGGDPDKYAETASLASGQKDQNLHGTFNDGGGDDLKITAETAFGTSGGTVAGSGDEDARVVVYFKLPKTLP